MWAGVGDPPRTVEVHFEARREIPEEMTRFAIDACASIPGCRRSLWIAGRQSHARRMYVDLSTSLERTRGLVLVAYPFAYLDRSSSNRV